VLQCEVFKNYMAILIEKNRKRQLKTVNLRSDKVSTHYFDSLVEVNTADG
jgi:16S rRNA G527 N7-methylase RsmG